MSAVRPDLPALLRSTGGPPVTRFAPSPTGYLHLGHVVNAIYVWGVARAAGGRVVLRLEDHDRLRCRPLYEARAPRGPGLARVRGGRGAHAPGAPERPHRGVRARRSPCSTARAASTPATARDGGSARRAYDGRCRERGLAREPGRGLRVRLDDAAGARRRRGAGADAGAPAADCGDLLVNDRDGHWTYQFAVTVDDTRAGRHAGRPGRGSGHLDRPPGGAGPAARPQPFRRPFCTIRSCMRPGRAEAQ